MSPDDLAAVQRSWAELRSQDGLLLAELTAAFVPVVPPGTAEARAQWLLSAVRALVGLVEAGEQVAVELRVQATHTKSMPMPDGSTVPPTGRTVDLTMAAFLVLDGSGQIRESHRYQDNLALFRQLGLG